MKLKDVELLPGVVIDADDPKHRGRVKLAVPGVFDPSTMNKEGLPWVCPLMMFGYQQFSKMINGSKVWLFKIDGNSREFWYIPMFQLNADSSDMINEYGDVDVIYSRSNGPNAASMHYSDNKGLSIKVGADTGMDIDHDNTVTMKTDSVQLSLDGGQVLVGKGADHPMVLGDDLCSILEDLKGKLNTLALSAAKDPHTAVLQPDFQAASDTLNGLRSKILSSVGKVKKDNN